MSASNGPGPDSAELVKQNPEALVLRGRPRPAVRFRRGLIVGVAACTAAGVLAVAWFALDPPALHGSIVVPAPGQTGRGARAEAIADVPESYAQVPRLGPALPGDLGRPILEHRRMSAAGPPSETLDSADEPARARASAEAERLAAERQAARTSAVLVQLHAASVSPPAGPVVPAPGSGQTTSSPAVGGEQGAARAAETADYQASLPDGSARILSAGTIIPASLITGINSDLPGMVLAQVTENVRDSATGAAILIPQGARLIGSYDSKVSFGQDRALLVWTKIVFPDGSSIDLDKMPASDVSGYAGLRDKVDSHSWQLLKGIVLSTLLGVGTQVSLGRSESELVRAVRESAQLNAADAGQQITSRNLDVRPTIVVRPGWPVRAVLNNDLVLQPWRG